MKKVILCMFLLPLWPAQKTYAQAVLTTLFVSPRPPATLSEWADRKDIMYYEVNQGPAGATVLIKTEIRLIDGTQVAVTNLTMATPIALPFGNSNGPLSTAHVLPLENMIFNGKYKTALERTGKLLSENYQICVQLVRPGTFAPISEPKCRNFFIASLQLPTLMKPYNEEALDATAAQTAVIFRWTPPVPKPTTPVKYRIQVFEVMPYQNPVQAMRSNFPVLNQEVISTTQYIWQPRGILKTNGEDENGQPDLIKMAKYVWTVQSTDMNGIPLGDGNINGDGRSEPFMFFVKPVAPAAFLRQMGDTGKPLTSAPTFGPGNTPHLIIADKGKGAKPKPNKPIPMNPPPTVPSMPGPVSTLGGGNVPHQKTVADTGKKPLTSAPTFGPGNTPHMIVAGDSSKIKSPPGTGPTYPPPPQLIIAGDSLKAVPTNLPTPRPQMRTTSDSLRAAPTNLPTPTPRMRVAGDTNKMPPAAPTPGPGNTPHKIIHGDTSKVLPAAPIRKKANSKRKRSTTYTDISHEYLCFWNTHPAGRERTTI